MINFDAELKFKMNEIININKLNWCQHAKIIGRISEIYYSEQIELTANLMAPYDTYIFLEVFRYFIL